MMIRLLHTILLVLLLTPAYGQASGAWRFYGLLSEMVDKYGQFDCEEIRLAQFDARLFASAAGRMKLPERANWQLVHIYDYHWEKIVGQPPTVYLSGDPTVALPVIQQCPSSWAPGFSSETLIDGFELRANADLFLTQPLTAIPGIRLRDDPLNGLWTSIVVGDYLIIRYVASYPDGSMTSFYREIKLYFRRMHVSG